MSQIPNNAKIVFMTPEDAQILAALATRVDALEGRNTPMPRRRLSGVGGGGGDMIRLKIVSEELDYLVCHTWDGTTEGTDPILVAKPHGLRLQSLGGTTINQYDPETNTTIAVSLVLVVGATASASSLTATATGKPTEHWYTTPSYQVGEEIIAFIPAGGTGVVVLTVPVIWQEANHAGRCLARAT